MLNGQGGPRVVLAAFRTFAHLVTNADPLEIDTWAQRFERSLDGNVTRARVRITVDADVSGLLSASGGLDEMFIHEMGPRPHVSLTTNDTLILLELPRKQVEGVVDGARMLLTVDPFGRAQFLSERKHRPAGNVTANITRVPPHLLALYEDLGLQSVPDVHGSPRATRSC